MIEREQILKPSKNTKREICPVSFIFIARKGFLCDLLVNYLQIPHRKTVIALFFCIPYGQDDIG